MKTSRDNSNFKRALTKIIRQEMAPFIKEFREESVRFKKRLNKIDMQFDKRIFILEQYISMYKSRIKRANKMLSKI